MPGPDFSNVLRKVQETVTSEVASKGQQTATEAVKGNLPSGSDLLDQGAKAAAAGHAPAGAAATQAADKLLSSPVDAHKLQAPAPSPGQPPPAPPLAAAQPVAKQSPEITSTPAAIQSVTAHVEEAKQAVNAIPEKLLQAKATQLEDLINHNKISKCDSVMKDLVAAGRVDLVEQAISNALSRNDTPVNNGLFDPNGALDIVKKYKEIAGPALGEQGLADSLANIGKDAIYARLHNGYKNGSEERLKDHVEKIAQFCFGVDGDGAAQAVKPIAEQVVDRYRGEGLGAQADRMCREYGLDNKPRAALAGELRETLLDPDYSAEEKVALVKSFQLKNDLSRSDMRGLIDEALKGQEAQVGDLPLDKAKRLHGDVSKVIDGYSGGIDLDRPGSKFEDALEARIAKLEKSETQRQQAEEREARAAEARAREEEAKKAAAQRVQTRAGLEERVGDVLLDLEMSSKDKVDALRAIQKEGELSDQDLRNAIGAQLKDRADGLAGELDLKQTQKLKADMEAIDNSAIRNGVFGLWENNDFQRDLDKRESTLQREDAARQQAEEREARAAEARAREEEAKKAAAQRVQTRAGLEERVGDVLLDLEMSSKDKIDVLRAIQKEGKLSDQDLRDVIGAQLKDKADGLAGELDLKQTQKLKADMEAIDNSAIRNGVFGLWENNDFQRDLDKRESTLQREEVARQQAEEREARRVAKEDAASLMRGLDRESIDGNKAELDKISKERGINQKEVFKETLADLAAEVKSSADKAEMESKLFAYGQMAGKLGMSANDVVRALEQSANFSPAEKKSIRAMVKAGYAYERE